MRLHETAYLISILDVVVDGGVVDERAAYKLFPVSHY